MNGWMTRWWIWLVLVIVLFGSIAGGMYYFQRPPLEKYGPVLAAIADHHVTADARGRVDLSKQFPGITDHNDAYATWRDDGSFTAMFPTYYGQGQQVAGLLYTSRPLTDADVHYREGVITFDVKLISVGSYEYLVLDKRVNDHWYHVSYKMH